MTAEEWSAELKYRHHYGKSLDPHAKPADGMDLVTLDDIREIQADGQGMLNEMKRLRAEIAELRSRLGSLPEEIFGTKGVTPLSNYPGR